MTNPTQIMQVAGDLTSWVEDILPPVAVLERCRRFAEGDSRLDRLVIGRSQQNVDIEAYRFGTSARHVLLYAFPDPGEAVGGTTILSLIKGLLEGHAFLSSLDVTWHFIPCLNFDDQPEKGQVLASVFRTPSAREVDWCVDNPRPETRALLEYARAIRPIFTYPLHDEFHCGESVPLYFVTAGTLPSALLRSLVSVAAAFGFAVAQEGCEPKVIDMAFTPDFPKSTFSHLARHGLVLMGEVSQQRGIPSCNLVSAQLAFGLIALQYMQSLPCDKPVTRLPMPRPVPTFCGQFVTLRPPDPAADAGDYFEMNRDPDMHTWTGNRVLTSVDEAQAELERFAAMDDISTWMIVDNPTGRVVGRFFLCLEDRDGVRVVGEGNRIAKPYWRKGHNREARAILFRYAFSELCADVIETSVWAGNINSVKSIETHGFRFHHEERKWNDKYAQEMALRVYVMTRQEWEYKEAKGKFPQ